MLSKFFNNNNSNLNKELLFLFSLYLSLLISFFYGENSTGGAILDYNNQKIISSNFASYFKETFYNYDNYSTRHSPVLIIFLSIFERFNFDDFIIRIIHLHICLLLPYFFLKILKLRFKDINNKILILLTGLIFLSPTFRSLSIWPDSRILGLTFFTLSILYFLKFKDNLNFNFAIMNVITCALSAYISPNFSVFSLFFFYGYIKIFKLISKKIFIISIINLLLAIPAIYYIFVLEINFLNKTAAINFDNNDRIFFSNIFNDILISISIIFFYLLPFLMEKIIKISKIIEIKNILLSLIVFSFCIYFFNYNYSYSGGGIFFKISNYFFSGNLLFYIIGFISITIFFPHLLNNKENLIFFILILINNPQYTIYHKYFDPFLLIIFFSLFNFEISLKGKKLKNFYLIYSYFLIFLIISNFKFLWTT